MQSRSSLRRWSWTAVCVATLTLAACRPEDGTEAAAPPAPAPARKIHVRKEIHSLSAAEIEAFKKGIALMQSRPADDPTSWTYQANIHGYPKDDSVCPVTPGEAQEAWGTCEHGTFLFSPWHRLYIYYFERILRAAVREAMNDPDYELSVPYWDYANPEYHQLPEPFRLPANPAANPLYIAQRTATCNEGGECVTAQQASAEQALALLPFCSCPDGESCVGCSAGLLPDETFGGVLRTGSHHDVDFAADGELAIIPHGPVHGAVGGWFVDFDCTGRDPLFWLHHANLDRLWQVWLNQGGGRENPLSSKEWTTQQFTFFDEKGQKVVATACDALHMVDQLGYRYEGVPVENVELCGEAAVPPPAAAAPQRKVLAASTPAQLELGTGRVTAEVPLPQEAGQRLLTLAETSGRLRLVVEGIRVLRTGMFYEAYLNLPEGAEPDPAGPHFLGHVAPFMDPRHGGETSRSFDITDEVQALRQQGQWTDEVRVTFVPALRQEVAGGSGPFLRFSRLSILER